MGTGMLFSAWVLLQLLWGLNLSSFLLQFAHISKDWNRWLSNSPTSKTLLSLCTLGSMPLETMPLGTMPLGKMVETHSF